MAERRGGAVSRQEADVITQRKKFRADRFHQLRKVPVAMFPSTDRMPEQDVPYEGEFSLRMVVSQVSLRMPRTVEHGNALGAEADAIAVAQPSIWSERTRTNAETLTLFMQRLQQMLVCLVGTLDARPGRCSEFCGAARMIHVAMRYQYDLELEFLPLQKVLELIYVAARIDDSRLRRGLTPKDRAVLLEARDRQALKLHRLCGYSRDPASGGAGRPPLELMPSAVTMTTLQRAIASGSRLKSTPHVLTLAGSRT
jgi:hypothetical protein